MMGMGILFFILGLTAASYVTVVASMEDGFPHASPKTRRSVPTPDYNINTLPPNEIPQNVEVSILIASIEDIKAEQITIEMNFRIQWKDQRLAPLVTSFVNSPQGSTKSNFSADEAAKSEFFLLEPSMLSKIWVPDIYFDHLKANQQPAVLQKPASLRLYEDKSVRYSVRTTISVACPMHYQYYPADTQRCDVDLKSYGYTEDKLVLSWREDFGANFANPINLPNFFTSLDNPNSFKSETLSGRKYSGLRFTVILTRKLSYHVNQTFLPSIILVIVSFLSFWISLDAVPARTALLMTCLLTLMTMFAAVRQSTPNVSYVKAIDTWMVFCVVFVFAALLEFVVALKLKAMKGKVNSRKSKKQKCFSVTTPEDIPLQARFGNQQSEKQIEEASPPQNPPPPLPSRLDRMANDKFIGKLEFVSSIVLPSLFFLFNLIYWPSLIISSEYLNSQGV